MRKAAAYLGFLKPEGWTIQPSPADADGRLEMYCEAGREKPMDEAGDLLAIVTTIFTAPDGEPPGQPKPGSPGK